MKSFFLNIIFATFALYASAQNTLTLKQAVEIGIKNNIDVLQADLANAKSRYRI